MVAVGRKSSGLSAEVRISNLIRERTGVYIQTRHLPMIESRLRSRIHTLNLSTLEDYSVYLESHFQDELSELISLLTTHY